MTLKKLKDFTLANGFRGSGGVLARAVSKAEAKEEYKCLDDLYCGDNDINLYYLRWPRRLLTIENLCKVPGIP